MDFKVQPQAQPSFVTLSTTTAAANLTRPDATNTVSSSADHKFTLAHKPYATMRKQGLLKLAVRVDAFPWGFAQMKLDGYLDVQPFPIAPLQAPLGRVQPELVGLEWRSRQLRVSIGQNKSVCSSERGV